METIIGIILLCAVWAFRLVFLLMFAVAVFFLALVLYDLGKGGTNADW